MTDEEDRKKFWKRRNPFFDLFSEFDRMDEMMDEMMKRAFEGVEVAKDKPLSYGFSMRIGPDGKPQIREFGNLQPTDQKIKVRGEREPLVDVIDKEKEIDVLAELPGVEKKDIQVNATEDTLSILVPNKFSKQIPLKEKVKEDVRAQYKNGVLTVTLQKQKPSKRKKTVKIE
jgi:HSP20 family protein